jgi:hypothetical protein
LWAALDGIDVVPVGAGGGLWHAPGGRFEQRSSPAPLDPEPPPLDDPTPPLLDELNPPLLDELNPPLLEDEKPPLLDELFTLPLEEPLLLPVPPSLAATVPPHPDTSAGGTSAPDPATTIRTANRRTPMTSLPLFLSA